MIKKFFFIFLIILCCIIACFLLLQNNTHKKITTFRSILPITPTLIQNPLSIQAMRSKSYPGSNITIEKILPDGDNYHQYLTSYKSDGLKIYALLTIPLGEKPKNGWPVILFNHGYIAPETYQTFPSVGQYASYYPVFSSHGYIIFKPDYRGNGNSEGSPQGAYFSPAYTTDDLNALASIKKYKDADPTKIGIWGHSMGGNITLRDLVIKPQDIKAAVIWGGVVGSYNQILNWHDPHYQPSAEDLALRYKYRDMFLKQYGSPEQNPAFWNSIDPTHFIKDIITPVQLDVGGSDEEVPTFFSQILRDHLKSAGKNVEYYEYPGDNHNISANFNLAMRNSLEFFDKYLK